MTAIREAAADMMVTPAPPAFTAAITVTVPELVAGDIIAGAIPAAVVPFVIIAVLKEGLFAGIGWRACIRWRAAIGVLENAVDVDDIGDFDRGSTVSSVAASAQR